MSARRLPGRSLTIVRALPLLAALALLRWLPSIAEQPFTGVLILPWRLDALTLIFLLALSLSIAIVPLRARHTPLAIGFLVLLIPALLLEHVLALPVALLIIGAALRRWRWLGAALVLLIGLLWLYLSGGAGWNDPAVAAALNGPRFGLLLLAAWIGLDLYPLSLIREPHDPLRLALTPIWLLPILRAIALGPWSDGWALAALLIGCVAALWAAATALWAAHDHDRQEQAATSWLGMALACIGLLTPVGVAAALWLTLIYPIGLALLLGDRRWRLWAGPLPIGATFVGCWLAQGATAASGAFVPGAAIWLAALIGGLATVRLWRAAPDDDPLLGALIDRSSQRFGGWLVGLTLLLGILAPLLLSRLIVPAVDLLQGGLTPYGLIDIWPWVGAAALDAGQRRVAVLPTIAVTALALIQGALVWMTARLLARTDDERAATTLDWRALREQVWWSAGARRRE